jgi:hypothetical protein
MIWTGGRRVSLGRELITLGQHVDVVDLGGVRHVEATQDGSAEPVTAGHHNWVPAGHDYDDEVAAGKAELEHAQPVLFPVVSGG